ncbi:MAG TPA: MFS transporter [Methylomirabilota bacterium]|nr:MFS transporter [Methylomirabilota bacterium]
MLHALLAAHRRLNPFTTPEARRFALLFTVVYFAQGMWYLPNQTITIVLKDAGFTAGGVANFFVIATMPWLIKPLYGLISDFFPLFGRRRQSYFMLTTSLAAAAGLVLATTGTRDYWPLLLGFTVMGLGLAFTDVLTDALMVENGRRLGLTGAFQSMQWAAIYVSAILVGEIGGRLAETRSLVPAFALAAGFPLLSLAMAATFLREPRVAADRAALRRTLLAVRVALGTREVWAVAGFIFFFMFSPSFGPGFLFYQTDRLGFSQHFIGRLAALQALGSVVGALTYAPLSSRWPLRRSIVVTIGLSAAVTLMYLLYRGPGSAIAIDLVYGWVYMVTTLAFLELAAKACPRHVEGTFFALMTSVYNAGVQLSQWTGGHLYDAIGFESLVVISAGATLLAWLLVPLVRIDAIEARARSEAAQVA